MTNYEGLTKNIDQLQSLGWSSEIDLDKYMLSDDEVVKKLIITKNPSITKDQADMIIDPEDKSLAKIEQDAKNKKNSVASSKNAVEKQQRLDTEKKKKTDEVKRFKAYYGNKLNEFYTEAKNIKTDIKNSFFHVSKETKDISKKSITSITQTTSAIPGIVLMIAAPPWNVPAAISYTMTIVEVFMDLIAKIKSIIPFLSNLKKLSSVMDSKNLTKISIILNAIIKTLIGFWKVIMSFDSIINALIKAVVDAINKNKPRIFRKATKKLKKLGYFSNNSTFDIDGTQVRANNENDADEVGDLLDTFKVDESKQKVVDYKAKIDLENLNKLSTQIDTPVTFADSNLDEQFSDFVYDVTLPNGSILYGIDESQLDDLKQTYNVIIEQIQDLKNVTV